MDHDNEIEAISFFVLHEPRSYRRDEPVRLGWERHIIYKSRRWPNHLGYGGSMIFIKLTDGRIILTNDLWAGGTRSEQNFVAKLPDGALVGVILSTRICQPQTKQALTALMDLLERPPEPIHLHSVWRTRSGLSDKEAHDLSFLARQRTAASSTGKKHRKRQQSLPQLPEVALRTYQGEHMSSTFGSPENAILTHVKVSASIHPFLGPEQLQDLDPTETPIFVLYRNGDDREGGLGSRGLGLQNGDTIDETFVYELEDWTG